MAYTKKEQITDLEAKATPIDADPIVIADTEDLNRAKKTTFTQLKAFLKTYLDTLYQPVATVLTNTTASFTTALKDKLDGIATGANNYTHPNHTGDVTSAGDGATTIANGAVTLAKQANMATASVVYRKTAGDGAPEVQTLATLKTDLGLTGTNSGDQDLTGLVEKATLTTKGDVYVATASATPARLGVGTNGQVLTADSAEATGVKWSSPSGGVNDGDKGDITVSSSGSVWTIDNDVVTNAKAANMATSTIKGRVTAETGDPEDLTATQVRTLINVADGANNYTHPNHSGDVTSSGDGATTIANDAVTYAKMQNVSATSRVLGRITAGAGDVEELTGANIRTIANVADGATADTKATGAELDTGTDDAKYATAKAIKDSKNVPSVAPSTAGKVLRSNGTDWTSDNIVAGDLPSALTPTTIELGHASDTTIARVSAGVASIEGKVIVTSTTTTTTSSATPTPTGDAVRNELIVTALAENATIAAPSGTAVAGNMLKIIITASGGTRTVGYNAALTAGNITRTTSVPTGKTLVQVYQYQNSTWKCHYNDLEA